MSESRQPGSFLRDKKQIKPNSTDQAMAVRPKTFDDAKDVQAKRKAQQPKGEEVSNES